MIISIPCPPLDTNAPDLQLGCWFVSLTDIAYNATDPHYPHLFLSKEKISEHSGSWLTRTECIRDNVGDWKGWAANSELQGIGELEDHGSWVGHAQCGPLFLDRES
jgi:hypothetical protein